MHRLLEADKTLSQIVAKLVAGASTPFMEAYNANVGVPIGSKKNKAEADKQDNAEAVALRVFDKNGVGDGAGLGMAGGADFVISLLKSETDLTAADIVNAARGAAALLGDETIKEAGAAVGITSGRGVSLNPLGGSQSIAEAAAAAKITPDELVEAHGAVMPATMHDNGKKLVEELLDALQVRAHNSFDLEFPPSFKIRA
jgi:hypothetical protein